MSEISALFSGASGIWQMLQDAVKARDWVKTEQAMSDLRQRLSQSELAALEVIERLKVAQMECEALRKRIQQIEEKQIERSQYRLVNLASGNEGIFMVYACSSAKNAAGELVTVPEHYLCYTCIERNVKTAVIIESGNARCPVCGHSARITPTPQTSRAPAPDTVGRIIQERLRSGRQW